MFYIRGIAYIYLTIHMQCVEVSGFIMNTTVKFDSTTYLDTYTIRQTHFEQAYNYLNFKIKQNNSEKVNRYKNTSNFYEKRCRLRQIKYTVKKPSD